MRPIDRMVMGALLTGPLIAGVVLSACSNDANEGAGVRAVDAVTAFPAEDLQDWKSYGDAVVVVSITKETRLPATPEEIASGEAVIPREVSARTDEVVWTRPGAEDPPQHLSFTSGGWLTKEGQEQRYNAAGLPVLEVGGRYLLPIAHYEATTPEDEDGWGSMAAWVAIDGSEGGGSIASAGQASDRFESLDGTQVSEVRDLLASIEPEPATVDMATADPDERYAAVTAAGGPDA